MKLLILSDSHHTDLESLDFEKYDAVLHCGDYGNSYSVLMKNHVFFVKGNCDLRGEEALLLELYGKSIFITHGHRENVKYGLDRLIYKSLEKNASITLFGHTHEQCCFKEEGILFINPGSFPRSYVIITDEDIQLFKDGKVKSIQYRW